MQRYPEADLTGEILSAERHPTIPTVTVLRVRMEPHDEEIVTRIYVFEKMLDTDDLEGRCLRADVLALPQNDAQSDDRGTLIAMEWCIHQDGPTTRADASTSS